jgi:hypothetical protein
MPKRVRAAAGPSSGPDDYDYDPTMEVISIPATTTVKEIIFGFSRPSSDVPKYRDPLHVLQDYIAEVSAILQALQLVTT